MVAYVAARGQGNWRPRFPKFTRHKVENGIHAVAQADLSGTLEGMEPTTQPQRSIDVTGLPDEAIRAVESLVSLLRRQPAATGGRAAFSSRAAWSKALREWADSHQPVATPADWSRESIYTDRGE
jgi:hypothetical protein